MSCLWRLFRRCSISLQLLFHPRNTDINIYLPFSHGVFYIPKEALIVYHLQTGDQKTQGCDFGWVLKPESQEHQSQEKKDVSAQVIKQDGASSFVFYLFPCQHLQYVFFPPKHGVPTARNSFLSSCELSHLLFSLPGEHGNYFFAWHILYHHSRMGRNVTTAFHTIQRRI